MGDCYKEILISRDPRGSDTVKKILLVLADILLACMGIFLVPFMLVGFLIMIFVTVYLFQNMKVEYEYIYVNGDFEIARIMNKERRKKSEDLSLNQMIIAARTGSDELKGPLHDARVMDYTSGSGRGPGWTLIYNNGDSGKKAIMLEMDDREIMDDLWHRAPGKVIRDRRYQPD